MDLNVDREMVARSLAEKLSGHGKCPIPFTHDRLQELHYWWHELARNYHEPDPFRWSIGAFVQAARSITFMLQKEKSVFPEFGWYEEWASKARENVLLKWLHDTRTDVVHHQALEPHSWLEIRCIGNPSQGHGDEEDPFRFKANPFACTHRYIQLGPWTDHGHEFVRHWSMEGLNDREFLDAAGEIYDQLDSLVVEAHRQIKHGMTATTGTGSPGKGSKRAVICMEETDRPRTARTVVQDGKEVWIDEPPGLHTEQEKSGLTRP